MHSTGPPSALLETFMRYTLDLPIQICRILSSLCIVKTNCCRPLHSHPRYSFPATLRLALSPSISFCVHPVMHWYNWSRQLGTAIAQFLLFTPVSIRMSYSSRAPTINLQDSITWESSLTFLACHLVLCELHAVYYCEHWPNDIFYMKERPFVFD